MIWLKKVIWKMEGFKVAKKIFPIVILILLIFVFIVQAMEKNETKETNTNVDNIPGLEIGVMAPDFQLKTIDGEVVKLSDYKGKKVILNFWATWCPPCKKEIPELQAFHERSGDEITILGVNIDTNNQVEDFVKERKITFPVLLDHGEKVSKMYQVIAIPTTYFIDEKGLIRHKHLGAVSKKLLKEHTEDL